MMKFFLFILVLCFVSACGINEKNRRSVRVSLKDGNELKLLVLERKSFVSEQRTLMIYANEHPIKIRDCAAAEFRNFGDEVFFETVKQTDSPAINSGEIRLAIPQSPPDKPYCIYSYAKKDNGEWIAEN